MMNSTPNSLTSCSDANDARTGMPAAAPGASAQAATHSLAERRTP